MSNKLKITMALSICLFVAVICIVVAGKAFSNAKTENEQANADFQNSIVATPDIVEEPTEPEDDFVYPDMENDVAANDGMSPEVIEENMASGIEALESIASCYDTSTESEYNYTGVPQVDNCIGTLLGSGQFTLIDDAEDTIDSVPVHLYIVGINDAAFTVVYYPDVEAVAIPMGMSVEEYIAGENSDED